MSLETWAEVNRLMHHVRVKTGMQLYAAGRHDLLAACTQSTCCSMHCSVPGSIRLAYILRLPLPDTVALENVSGREGDDVLCGIC